MAKEEKIVKGETNDKVVNKVVVNGVTKLDLTIDDVTAGDVAYGKKFHLPSGATATGTSTKDSDTTDANATAAEIISGKTAYVNKNKVTGTMTNQGSMAETIDTVAEVVTIPAGYHDGSGSVKINTIDQEKLKPENIKQGVEILSVIGTHSGSGDVKATVLNATPTHSLQDILPSSLGDYTHFTECKIAAIPVTESENAQGGLTLTI